MARVLVTERGLQREDLDPRNCLRDRCSIRLYNQALREGLCIAGQLEWDTLDYRISGIVLFLDSVSLKRSHTSKVRVEIPVFRIGLDEVGDFAVPFASSALQMKSRPLTEDCIDACWPCGLHKLVQLCDVMIGKTSQTRFRRACCESASANKKR